MPELEYPKTYTFTDKERGKEYDGPGVFDVPEDAVEQYLSRGWEHPGEETQTSETPDVEPASGPGDSANIDDTESESAGDRTGPTTDAEAHPEADPAAEVNDDSSDGADEANADAGEQDALDDTEDEVTTDGAGSDADTGSDLDSVDYGDLTVNEINDLLDEQDFSNAELRRMRDHEAANKNRTSAISLLESELDADSE